MSTAGNILSIGLGDLVSARNAALRTAGFDLAIVGHAFSIVERAEFVRCTRGDFRQPVILIDEGQVMASLRVDSHIHVNDSAEELIRAVERLMNGKTRSAIAV